MRSTRFVVLRVELDHAESADPDLLCEEVSVCADAEEGAVVDSEVVAVFPATLKGGCGKVGASLGGGEFTATQEPQAPPADNEATPGTAIPDSRWRIEALVNRWHDSRPG